MCLSLGSCAIEPVLTDILDSNGLTSAPFDLCGDGVLDPGEGCDDGNPLVGDGCLPNCWPGGPLAPVWSVSGPTWQSCLAVGGGALVLGGAAYDGPARLGQVPLAPTGPPAWSHVGPTRREYGALAIAGDGTIVAAAADWSQPEHRLWLGRFTAAGVLLESHEYPQIGRRPTHLQISAGGDLVVLAGGFPGPSQLAVFDAAGALQWVHTPPDDPGETRQYSGLALGDGGRIHVVGTRRADDYASRHLLVDTFTLAGAVVWQRELEAPAHIAGPQVVATPGGALLVAMGEQIASEPDDVEVAALARFDEAGALQWWRADLSVSAHGVTAVDIVGLPGGGAFVAWRAAGDDIASYVLARYTADGAQVYAVSAPELVFDLDAGPDGLVYSLEADEWGDSTRVVPYRP